MKIVFFCSSLEPGKDGVGDYTKLLAAELQNNFKCSVAIIALNDTKINHSFQGVQTFDNKKVDVLRLTATESITSRTLKAKTYIDQLNPDWISLQFVPYGFNDKGLAFGWPKVFKQLSVGRKVNIMFHELWIGISVISPLKHKLIGYFQKNIAKQLIKATHPEIVFTSNLLYKMVLYGVSKQVDLLPLFGNIPVATDNIQFKNAIRTQVGINTENNKNAYLMGVFGNLYPNAGLEKVLNNLLSQEDFKNKEPYLIGFGNISAEGYTEFQNLANQFKNKVKFIHLGVLNEKEVSNVLKMLDIGISTTPHQHIGKSGVFANMKLHGLEVLIPEGDILPEYDSQIREYYQNIINKPKHEWSVEFIANNFYNILLSKS